MKAHQDDRQILPFRTELPRDAPPHAKNYRSPQQGLGNLTEPRTSANPNPSYICARDRGKCLMAEHVGDARRRGSMLPTLLSVGARRLVGAFRRRFYFKLAISPPFPRQPDSDSIRCQGRVFSNGIATAGTRQCVLFSFF